MKTYMGREVARETIAFGSGGQIDRDGQPAMPPKSVVTLRLKATMDSVKHKFLDDGTVQEITTLVIDGNTVEVLEVAEPEADGDQLKLGEEPAPTAGPDAPQGFDEPADRDPATGAATGAAPGIGEQPHAFIPLGSKGVKRGICATCGQPKVDPIHEAA